MSRLDEEFQYYGLTLKQLQAAGELLRDCGMNGTLHSTANEWCAAALFGGVDAQHKQTSVKLLNSRLPSAFALHRPCDAGIEIHWGEFGVGGGTSPTGDKKATTAEEAAYTPFFGGWAGAAGNGLACLALHRGVCVVGPGAASSLDREAACSLAVCSGLPTPQ